jgi:hypothetical protein
MRRGLDRPCVNPYHDKPWPEDQELAVLYLRIAVDAQAELARRRASLPMKRTAYRDMLRLEHAENRHAGITQYSQFGNFELKAVNGLWECRSQLSAKECLDLAKLLLALDQSRDSWEAKCDHQRLIDANANWESHLRVILDDWSGQNPYEWTKSEHFKLLIQLRILAIDLAIRAYQLDEGPLPATLRQLVPKYLDAIPTDPYGNAPLRYRVTKGGHTIYSVGPDGDDDAGRPVSNPPGEWDGDYTDSLLFPPPVPPPAPNTGTGSQQP